MTPIIIQYLIVLIAVLVYILFGYLKTVPLEKIDPYKLGGTIIVGVVIGSVFIITGNPITQETVEAQVIVYGGLIFIVESGLKLVVRRLFPDGVLPAM